MGKKLPPEQLQLYQGIDVILWEDWDPIGVYDDIDAKDEYQSYLLQVFQLALQNASSRAIAEYLHWVVIERMELPSTVDKQLPIAEKIQKLKLKLIPIS